MIQGRKTPRKKFEVVDYAQIGSFHKCKILFQL